MRIQGFNSYQPYNRNNQSIGQNNAKPSFGAVKVIVEDGFKTFLKYLPKGEERMPQIIQIGEECSMSGTVKIDVAQGLLRFSSEDLTLNTHPDLPRNERNLALPANPNDLLKPIQVIFNSLKSV